MPSIDLLFGLAEGECPATGRAALSVLLEVGRRTEFKGCHVYFDRLEAMVHSEPSMAICPSVINCYLFAEAHPDFAPAVVEILVELLEKFLSGPLDNLEDAIHRICLVLFFVFQSNDAVSLECFGRVRPLLDEVSERLLLGSELSVICAGVAALPDSGDDLVAIIDRVQMAAEMLIESVTGMESLLCGVALLLVRFGEQDIMVRLLDILQFIFLNSPYLQVKISCFRVYEYWKKVSVPVVFPYIRRMVYEAIIGIGHFYDGDGLEETAQLVHTCGIFTAAFAGVPVVKDHVIQWAVCLILTVEQIPDLLAVTAPSLRGLVKKLADQVQPEMGVVLGSETRAGETLRRFLNLDSAEEVSLDIPNDINVP
jgi:hypothetical protein